MLVRIIVGIGSLVSFRAGVFRMPLIHLMNGLLREFGRRTRASRKHYLACKREVRGEKGVVRKRTAYLINILIAYVCLPEVQNLNTIQHNILNELLTVGSLLTN